MEKSRVAVRACLDGEDPLQALASVKFKELAVDPIKGTPLNFIEMLNQAYSDLVVLYGVEHLLSEYPGQTFEIRLGAQSGYDIESIDGKIVGECFSVTKMRSNSKLKKDTEKLMQADCCEHRYIFFYSEQDSDEKICAFTEKYPEIAYIRVKEFRF